MRTRAWVLEGALRVLLNADCFLQFCEPRNFHAHRRVSVRYTTAAEGGGVLMRQTQSCPK